METSSIDNLSRSFLSGFITGNLGRNAVNVGENRIERIEATAKKIVPLRASGGGVQTSIIHKVNNRVDETGTTGERANKHADDAEDGGNSEF